MLIINSICFSISVIDNPKMGGIYHTAITLLSHASLLALHSYQIFRAYSGALML